MKKILVVIPHECYQTFLQACPSKAYEFKQSLVNGIIVNDDPVHGRAVEIYATEEHAKALLALARMVCPAAVPYIDESIRLDRTPA